MSMQNFKGMAYRLNGEQVEPSQSSASSAAAGPTGVTYFIDLDDESPSRQDHAEENFVAN